MTSNLYSSDYLYSRAEVSRHDKRADAWIILHGEVYNVTRWLDRHPGGGKLLVHYAGEDATLAFESFHNDKDLVNKYLSAFRIGRLVEEERALDEVSDDFLVMRKDLEEKGLFKFDPLFYTAVILHIALLELVSLFVLWCYGNGWSAWILAGLIGCVSSVQAGWLQHDLGHRSVSHSTWLDDLLHNLVIGFGKGLSSHWWNYRHNQHHAKPNVLNKDPDITIPFDAFLLGDVIPVEVCVCVCMCVMFLAQWGKKHRGWIPYQLQHIYFLFIPPFVSMYFHLEMLLLCLAHGKWKNLLWISLFYVRWHLLYSGLLGGFWAAIGFYWYVRALEGLWFMWATQINHLPMPVDVDHHDSWSAMQLTGTCNVESSWFADWFLGHLDFQIEHHLFPTMPRHNFWKAQPYVREFCARHNLHYQIKTLSRGFADILHSLKESGTLWVKSWEMTTHKD